MSAAEELAEFDRIKAARGGRLKVLSTLPFFRIPFWCERVHTLEMKPSRLGRLTQRIGVDDPWLILRLLREAPRADVVLVNGGERSDLIYLAIAGLLPWIRTPHVIVDAHWQADTGVAGWMQRTILRLGMRLVREVQPHSVEEIETYRTRFGIPRERIRPLPWSTSLTGYEDIRPASPRHPHIVSGGHSYRDYATLFEAARVAGLPVRVGLMPCPASAGVQALAAGNPDIEIVDDWTNAEYWQEVASARVFAMPIVPGLTRSTAAQTILNAMSYGTVVVATDSIGSRVYIRHGENGFLVPPGDTQAWVQTLQQVFAMDEASYQRVSQCAVDTVERDHREDLRLARTLRRAALVIRPQTGRPGPLSSVTG